jgi:hypothetical protein
MSCFLDGEMMCVAVLFAYKLVTVLFRPGSFMSHMHSKRFCKNMILIDSMAVSFVSGTRFIRAPTTAIHRLTM